MRTVPSEGSAATRAGDGNGWSRRWPGRHSSPAGITQRASWWRTGRTAVVVDNGSVDGSVEAATGREAVAVIRNPENRGFAAAANQGAALGRGEWLLFVNPDAHVGPGDVAALLSGVPADVAAAAPLQ